METSAIWILSFHPPQSLRVTKELVHQGGVRWPCFSSDNIERTVLEQLLTGLWSCVTRTAIHLAKLGTTVHVNIRPVVCCSQSNQDDMVCSGQVLVAICGIEVRVFLMPFSCCERFDDGLLIFVGKQICHADQGHIPLWLGNQLTQCHGLHNVRESTGMLDHSVQTGYLWHNLPLPFGDFGGN